MKILLLIFVSILIIGCAGTTNTRSLLINNDTFEDYVPWWATNQVDGFWERVPYWITNGIDEVNYPRLKAEAWIVISDDGRACPPKELIRRHK